MTDTPQGSAGASPKPSKGAPQPGQSKQNQKGVADHKAMELEDEFRSKHLGVMGVLSWIL